MRRLLVVLWLVAPGWAQAPLDLSVEVPMALSPAPVTDAAPTPLAIRLSRADDGPREVTLVVDAPFELGGPSQRTVALDGRVTEVRHEVLQPAGPARVWDFPVYLLEGGRQRARFDVRLSKAGPWWMCGPFEGNREQAHERVFPPEEGIDLAGVFAGKGDAAVRWQPFPARAMNEAGYGDLNLALGPTENAATYLYAVCESPAAATARCSLGSDDSVKVWVNGEMVFGRNEHRGAAPDQDAFGLSLRQGRNEFLLKIVNDDGGYGFYFRLVDPPDGLTWHSGVGPVPLREPEFRVTGVTGTTASFAWRSDSTAPTRLWVVPAEPGRRLVGAGTPKQEMIARTPGTTERGHATGGGTTRPTATVDGLEPGRRYLAWVEAAVGGQPSETLAIYTAPPAGMTQFLHLKVIVCVFEQTIRQKDKDRECPIAVCPPAEIERIRREIGEAVRWYWVNTGGRLFLDVDYVVDPERFVVPDDNVYGVGYSPGDEERLVAVLRENGRDIGDYDGRIFISYEPVFDEANNRWYQPATGGGTIGPEWGPGNAKCAWRCGYNHAWLFCHEFGHGLDALWANSGAPEWIFNHFQPWDQTAHQHGEHWDGNAWLLWWFLGYVTREQQDWPFRPADQVARFFQCRFGTVRQTADADGDGLADLEPLVPVDEQRFNSSPAHADTDDDGLGDLLEMMACQWLEHGLEAQWGGPYARLGADPRNPDTDFDGQLDGADRYPLYPIDTDLRRGVPREFCRLDDATGQARWFVGWDTDALTIRLWAPRAPERADISLDADDNGWYLGTDNYQIWLNPGDAERPCRVTFQDCGVPDKWPFWDDAALTADDWSFTQTVTEAGWLATVRLPRKPEKGLACNAGERIGLRFGIRPVGAPRWEGQNGLRGPFEPHTFVSLQLAP